MNTVELGQQIRQLRLAAGISQQQMSDDLALSRATLSGLEKGRSGDIGIRKIIKILDYLGMELTVVDKSPFPTFEKIREETNK